MKSQTLQEFEVWFVRTYLNLIQILFSIENFKSAVIFNSAKALEEKR